MEETALHEFAPRHFLKQYTLLCFVVIQGWDENLHLMVRDKGESGSLLGSGGMAHGLG